MAREILEIAQAQYCPEGIGLVSTKAKSHVKPLDLPDGTSPKFVFRDGNFAEFTYAQQCLLDHIIDDDDCEALRYYHNLAIHFANQHNGDDDEDNHFEVFPQEVFRRSVRQGRIVLVANMIRWARAGLPLKQLVETTGVELKEQQLRYCYEGLSVNGTKRHKITHR